MSASGPSALTVTTMFSMLAAEYPQLADNRIVYRTPSRTRRRSASGSNKPLTEIPLSLESPHHYGRRVHPDPVSTPSSSSVLTTPRKFEYSTPRKQRRISHYDENDKESSLTRLRSSQSLLSISTPIQINLDTDHSRTNNNDSIIYSPFYPLDGPQTPIQTCRRSSMMVIPPLPSPMIPTSPHGIHSRLALALLATTDRNPNESPSCHPRALFDQFLHDTTSAPSPRLSPRLAPSHPDQPALCLLDDVIPNFIKPLPSPSTEPTAPPPRRTEPAHKYTCKPLSKASLLPAPSPPLLMPVTLPSTLPPSPRPIPSLNLASLPHYHTKPLSHARAESKPIVHIPHEPMVINITHEPVEFCNPYKTPAIIEQYGLTPCRATSHNRIIASTPVSCDESSKSTHQQRPVSPRPLVTAAAAPPSSVESKRIAHHHKKAVLACLRSLMSLFVNPSDATFKDRFLNPCYQVIRTRSLRTIRSLSMSWVHESPPPIPQALNQLSKNWELSSVDAQTIDVACQYVVALVVSSELSPLTVSQAYDVMNSQ